MKDLDFATLVAVFQEMLGWTFWPLVVLAVLATLSFLRVLLRDRALIARRLVWAEVLGLFGGMAAVFIMFTVTSSSFADLGGPAGRWTGCLCWASSASAPLARRSGSMPCSGCSAVRRSPRLDAPPRYAG